MSEQTQIDLDDWIYKDNFSMTYPIGTIFFHVHVDNDKRENLELISNAPIILDELGTNHLWYLNKNRKEQLWNLIRKKDISINDIIITDITNKTIVIEEENN